MSAAASGPAAAARPAPVVWLVYLLIALLSAAAAWAGWRERAKVPILINLEGQVADWQLRRRGPEAPASPVPIEIVVRDERSAAELGGAAFGRRTLAALIDRLRADGAAWIALDILLTEASAGDPDADRLLADSIRRAGNVVLPFALPNLPKPPGGAASAPQVSTAMLGSAYTRYQDEDAAWLITLKPNAVLAPLPMFGDAARGLGHVSVQPGLDGGLRHELPALPYDGELFPDLPVTLAALALGIAPADREVRLGRSLRLGTRDVPLDETSQLWVNYLGPAGSFPTWSLSDVLAGRTAPGRFQGKIVLIGADAQTSTDRFLSPFDNGGIELPGVERVATVTDNLMSGRWLERPPWAVRTELAGMLLLPLLAVAAIARRKPLRALGVVLVLGALAVGGSQLALTLARQAVGPLFPLAAMMLATGLGLVWRNFLYERGRRQAEAQLRASEERFALAARGANDGLWDWDLVAGRSWFSPRARQMMDWPQAAAPPADVPAVAQGAAGGIAAVGLVDDADVRRWLDGLEPPERRRFEQELQAHLAGETQQLHHELRHLRGGEPRWTLVRGVAVREDGQAVRMAGSLTDITESKRLETQVAFDALHDRLTGLANRELFAERLGQWLALPEPHAGLALVDIDGFRQVNELHGHVTGNQVLIEVASRLGSLSRERAEPTVVARVGPDQFAVAVQGPMELLVEVARAAQLALSAPMVALQQQWPQGTQAPATDGGAPGDRAAAGSGDALSVSIAFAHSEHALLEVDDLLNGAHLALSQARRAGQRGTMRSFDPAEQAFQNKRRWLDENIDRALAAGDQFQLHYQPFVRLADRRLVGFEALIRWKHPDRGMVMPGDFVPHAEQSGRINAIGRWTMFEAARQLVAWNALGFEGEIAVNLSGRQFTESDLEADAREVLAMLGDVAPHRYKLEVTESMAMENPQRTAKVLTRLADLGFKISIDDFGTGYSSLAYLHRFPFDTLKIDRSFVIRLGTGREAQEIVRTVVGLGAALDKQVLAEGVEDEPQARQLEALGVQVGQGWLFARALPPEDAVDWIRRA